MRAYAGRTARIAADAQGRGTLVRTSGIVPMKPSLLWLIHPWIVPVPGDAIGVGATWHVTQPLTMAAAQGELERTYQVTATQGDTLTLKVTGVTHWHAAGTAAGAGSDEAIEGTLVVGRGDVLARSGQVTSIQDLGPAKARVQLALTL